MYKSWNKDFLGAKENEEISNWMGIGERKEDGRKLRFFKCPLDAGVHSHRPRYPAGVADESSERGALAVVARWVRDDDNDMSTPVSTYLCFCSPTQTPHPPDAAGLRATCGNESDR